MPPNQPPRFTIVGGGLGGALMAVYLGKAGHDVHLYEMRGDLRAGPQSRFATAKPHGGTGGGRSINLALSHRGLCALERVDLADAVLKTAVPVRGRMMHSPAGRLAFQPYGLSGQANYSVSRSGLNAVLLNAAEQYDNVRLFFHRKCTGVDLETGRVSFIDTRSGEASTTAGGVVIGADGAFSAVRRSMQRLDRFDYSQDYLKHGYKELTIPPDHSGAFKMQEDALHIWPRRSFMMIALPNRDGSFTCTLFWPFEGPRSFGALKSREEVLRFFNEHFADAVPLLPTLLDDYFRNPTGSLVTVRCSPWYYKDRVVLIGDACHAVVPFYGQGMNAAFEDVLVLSEYLERHGSDRGRAFEAFHATRKADVDALADLAIANFVEMRDHTGSRRFLLKKKVEKLLHGMLPRWYIPLYTMVSYTRMPYVEAVRRAKKQDRIVRTLAAAVLVIILLVVGVAMLK